MPVQHHLTLREHGRTSCRGSGRGEVRYETRQGEVVGPIPRRQMLALHRLLRRDARMQGHNKLLVSMDLDLSLACSDRVGFAETPHVAVEVFPKYLGGSRESADAGHVALLRRELFGLLRYCRFFRVRPGEEAGQRLQRHPASEFVLYGMARRLVESLKVGLRYGYEERLAPLTAVRGRLDPARQVRQGGGLPLPLWCRYEEHDQESPLGRLLMLLAQMLGALCRTSATSTLAAQAAHMLEPVRASTNPWRDRGRLKLDRANEAFGESIAHLEILLRNMSADQVKGRARAWCFSVPLQAVFERYLEQLLRDLHRRFPARCVKLRLQYGVGHLTRDPRSFRQRPDVVIEGPGGCTILDAKYKHPDKGKPNEGDVRQVLTYATLWNSNPKNVSKPCRRVVLVYPRFWSHEKFIQSWKSNVEIPSTGETVELCVADIPFGRPPTPGDLESLLEQSSWLGAPD